VNALKRRYLAEMGIPVWQLRADDPARPLPTEAALTGDETKPASASPASGGQAPASLPPAGQQPAGAPPPGRPLVAGHELEAASPGRLHWEQLALAVRDCTRSGLHRGRTQTIFGLSLSEADLMIIGEPPGAE